MVDMSKAARVREQGLRTDISRQLDETELKQLVEKLKHGNIFEILSKVNAGDLQEFFKKQNLALRSEIYQDEIFTAMEGTIPEQNSSLFAVHHPKAMLAPGEGEEFMSLSSRYFSQSAGGGMKFKAQTLKGQKVASPEELGSMADDAVSDADQFLEDAWTNIIDNQMLQQYTTKMDDIMAEVKRIIELAKSGAIGPEFVILALAKVNATKNGVLFSWLGRKAFNVESSLNKIAQDLHNLSPTDPRFYARSQTAKDETSRLQRNLTQMTNDMQKIMQNLETTFEHAKSMIDDINRTKREIVNRMPTH